MLDDQNQRLAHLTLDIEHPTLEIGHWIREIWRKTYLQRKYLEPQVSEAYFASY